MSSNWTNFAYLISAILFILGLKGLTHPRTAVRGNMLGACGMLLAIVVTLLAYDIVSPWVIGIGLVAGAVVGAGLAIKIEMTAMPQLVALFNGFGGVASVFVAGAWLAARTVSDATTSDEIVAASASGLIGSVTFLGSFVAFAKLQGLKWFPDGNVIPAQKLVNALLFVLSILLSVFLVQSPSADYYFWLIVILGAGLGVFLVTPIGGADMPVVIALLNSYSGLAAAATGFVIGNNVLIIAGALVGASGLILTGIMCKAMNRSLTNVVFGTLAPSESGPSADEVYAGKIKSTSADEIAMLLETARKVVIVPGYGMAVSQAQHAVRDLSNLLESKNGSVVDYAIHPVAGRMPGHMNVLLAEANIPYDKLREMDDINPEMEQVDMAIVIGANDVVNPVARTDPKSPIAGMPIIDVDKARTVVVVKRSLSPGYAGIPNPLFAADNTLMYFSDGKKAFQELSEAVKET
ncbi:MAG: NAD(P)(+) transhydrogenase (Re/Si-specific) subunit beta [Phycisphaerales bacterium]|nr:NAD(P)(+) transhydrogenase (Re/Si-specific) subunit beta [Phycisphaerales bacterium]